MLLPVAHSPMSAVMNNVWWSPAHTLVVNTLFMAATSSGLVATRCGSVDTPNWP